MKYQINKIKWKMKEAVAIIIRVLMREIWAAIIIFSRFIKILIIAIKQKAFIISLFLKIVH